MKKVLTSLIGVMSVVTVANAEPYIGLNFTYDKVGLDSFVGQMFDMPTTDVIKPHLFGASFDAGYQFSDYVGIEGYFQYDFRNKQSVDDPTFGSNAFETKISFMSGGLDVLGYLPLNTCHSFNLIGSVGAGYYYFDQRISGEALGLVFGVPNLHFHENHLGARFGLGVQYQFNDSASIRAMGRYVTWNKNSTNVLGMTLGGQTDIGDFMRYMFEGSVGFQYKF